MKNFIYLTNIIFICCIVAIRDAFKKDIREKKVMISKKVRSTVKQPKMAFNEWSKHIHTESEKL